MVWGVFLWLFSEPFPFFFPLPQPYPPTLLPLPVIDRVLCVTVFILGCVFLRVFGARPLLIALFFQIFKVLFLFSLRIFFFPSVSHNLFTFYNQRNRFPLSTFLLLFLYRHLRISEFSSHKLSPFTPPR